MDTVNEPVLPSELERSIFEIAALSHRGSIPSLLLVAHRVYVWLEPLLYRVICTEASDLETEALKKALQSKPPIFFQGATRHIFLANTEVWTEDEIVQALQVCTELVDLAAVNSLKPAFLPALGCMRLRRLAGSLSQLFGSRSTIDLAHPFVTLVTHLDLFDFVDENDADLISGIVAMPSLSHLCLNESIPWSVIEVLLAGAPWLQLVLLTWHEESDEVPVEEHVKDMPIRVRDDIRFVMAYYGGYIAEWRAGADGKPNYWSYADDFVARKRAGIVDKSSHWLD